MAKIHPLADVQTEQIGESTFFEHAQNLLVQKYIIGEVDFNCAQKLRARVNWNAFPITVKESTTIQKYIVGYTDVYFYTGGIVENESDFATSLDNWEICSQW